MEMFVILMILFSLETILEEIILNLEKIETSFITKQDQMQVLVLEVKF